MYYLRPAVLPARVEFDYRIVIPSGNLQFSRIKVVLVFIHGIARYLHSTFRLNPSSRLSVKRSAVEAKRGAALMLDFSITGSREKCKIKSEVYNIDDVVLVWFTFKHPEGKPAGVDTNSLNIKMIFKKHDSALDYEIKLNVKCEQLNYLKVSSMWTNGEIKVNLGAVPIPLSRAYSLKLNLLAIKVEKITGAKLYDDTDLIDFQLSTEAGSVAVHKACLAMHSDVFKKMLLGKWKEATEGRVELKGVSLQTLQHLKQYIYLGTLPQDVRQLLFFAKCYLLDNLKQDCLMKLARTVSSKNLNELQEFACENNVIELSRLLLQVVTSDIIHGSHEKIKESNKLVKDKTENDAQNQTQNEK